MNAVQSSPIVLHNVTVGYDRHPALHHIDWTIQPASMVAVYGRNGAGKSTLLKTMAGELTPMTGHFHGLPRKIAWMPQRALPNLNFPATVWDLVCTGLWSACGLWPRVTGWHSPAQKRACHAAIAAVRLTGLERKQLSALSGGQLQRACFARVMVQDAELILLDEPFAAIDNGTTEDLLQLLHVWQTQGKTIVAVLHDLARIRAHFVQVLLLGRELVAAGPTETILATHLAQAEQFVAVTANDAALCDAISPGGHICAAAHATQSRQAERP